MSEIVTKAEFARLLGCAKSRISQLAKDGLPVRRDGRLNRLECLQWITTYQSGHGGGWGGGLRGPAIIDRAQRLLGGDAPADDADVLAELLSGDEARARRELFDTILRNARLIPEIALKLGYSRDMTQLIVAYEAFRSLALWLAGGLEDLAYDFDTDDIPPAIDFAAFAKKHKLAFSPEMKTKAEETLDPLDELLISDWFERALKQGDGPARKPKPSPKN